LRRLKPKEQEACGRLEAITRVRAGQSTVAAAARALGISRKTYYEWEDRALEAVTEALQDRRPGRPAKPVDPEKEELRQRLAELQRTSGLGLLHTRFRQVISRADLRDLAAAVRAEQRQAQLAGMRRIEWLIPGAVWAIDDLHVGDRPDGTRLWSTSGRDLASRFTLPETILGTPAGGEEIAGHLATQFERYGAPLVLKRDNGSNLNHAMVTEVCEQYGVIPLNSPPYYPPYNGGIEHTQGEIRKALAALTGGRQVPEEHLEVYLSAAIHGLNQKERRCLHGETAREALPFHPNRITFSRRERKQIHDEITAVYRQILDQTGASTRHECIVAWCHATENILAKHRILSVSRIGSAQHGHTSAGTPADTPCNGQEVLPHFNPQSVPELRW